MIRLRYFASLRETLGIADEQLELPAGVGDVADLTRWLRQRGSDWDNALADRAACRHQPGYCRSGCSHRGRRRSCLVPASHRRLVP